MHTVWQSIPLEIQLQPSQEEPLSGEKLRVQSMWQVLWGPPVPEEAHEDSCSEEACGVSPVWQSFPQPVHPEDTYELTYWGEAVWL